MFARFFVCAVIAVALCQADGPKDTNALVPTQTDSKATAQTETKATAQTETKIAVQADTKAAVQAENKASVEPSQASNAVPEVAAKDTQATTTATDATPVKSDAAPVNKDTAAKQTTTTTTTTTTTQQAATQTAETKGAKQDSASAAPTTDSPAVEAAKMDLQKKLQFVASESSVNSQVKLGATVSSDDAPAVPKFMIVSWYTDAACAGEVRASTTLDATKTCQYLPGYQIPEVKSAVIECSQQNVRGIATFYDTSCEAHAAEAIGRSLTVTLHDANCIAFPGTDHYAKVEACRDAESGAAQLLSPLAFAIMAVAAAFNMRWAL